MRAAALDARKEDGILQKSIKEEDGILQSIIPTAVTEGVCVCVCVRARARGGASVSVSVSMYVCSVRV